MELKEREGNDEVEERECHEEAPEGYHGVCRLTLGWGAESTYISNMCTMIYIR